jgi:imidazoleglycerol-phosphate dehydratase
VKARTATLQRKTRETHIELTLNLDGTGTSRVRTGIPFLDHMLELLARHALLDLRLRARGDLAVDHHHTVEDVGLVLGAALDRALGSREGISRYGSSHVPMDESLSRAVVDLGGRPYLVYRVALRTRRIRDFDVQLVEEFFRAVCVKGRLNLHLECLYGRDAHHALESVFKAVARALCMACARDPRVKGIPSSKGRL